MPRSSRSKSHKQSKHSSKDYSDLDDNNNGTENGGSGRVSKDSLISSEKRKIDVNDNVPEEFMPTKRRREKINSGRDRWNGVDDEVVSIDDKKMKAVESKSKISKKHDGEGGGSGSAVLEKSGGGSRSEKRPDKESGREEASDVKGNKSGREKNRDDWPIEDELRNIELEKELKKRTRRSDGYNDLKEGDERMLLSKIARSQDVKQREDKRGENGERVSKIRDVKYRTESEKDNKYSGDKHREEGERDRQQEDKHCEDSNRDNRYKNERYREDVDRDNRHKNWRAREDPDREKRDRDLKKLKDDSDRQTNNRGDSPMYDDRGARYKENKDRKRDNNTNKDEYNDFRTRGIKNQYSESEKRSVGDAKFNLISERGRPGSGSDDMDITGNHSRRRNSPEGKSYPSRDHYRISRQDRDYVDEDRKFDKVSSRPLEKIGPKDDNCTEDLALERRPRSEARSSPVVDICHISPSSTNNERRHLNRPDVRRNPDVEEVGPRSSGSKDAKEYSDNQFGVGSSEDDRSKLNNHNRRSSGDPNMGRPQNSWNNFSNWSSSPLPNNGYMPFHHGPTIFNPVIQQQFMPAMFSRPPMSMNHPGMPFPGHGNPGAWRNQVMEAMPPSVPLHVWEQNTPLFANGSPGYANWDHIGPQLNNQIWESNADMQSVGQKVDQTVQEHVDDVLPVEMDPHIENEQNQLVVNAPEVVNVTESSHIYEAWKEDDAHISRVYLSMIDISEDLTEPELFDQCKSILDSDQESVSDGSDCKILVFEDGIEAESSSGALLSGAIDDSVFKKAMSLYAKQKVHFGTTNEEGVLNVSEPVSTPDQEQSDPVDDEKLVEEALEDPVLEVKKENDEPPIPKLDMDAMTEEDAVNNNPKKFDETTEQMDMEVDRHAENQDKESRAPSVGVCDVSVKVEDVSDSYDGSMELDKSSGGDSLLHLTNVSTTELLESGSVNLSRIHDHSPESTH